MLSVPRAKVVRGYSFYGYSFVYVIFDDGTDPYWARSRVLEYLSSISGHCPRRHADARPGRHRRRWRSCIPSIPPTATSPICVDPGLVFEYQLTAVRASAEVASIVVS